HQQKRPAERLAGAADNEEGDTRRGDQSQGGVEVNAPSEGDAEGRGTAPPTARAGMRTYLVHGLSIKRLSPKAASPSTLARWACGEISACVISHFALAG